MNEKRSSYWKFVAVFIALVVFGLGAFIFSAWLQMSKTQQSAVSPSTNLPRQGSGQVGTGGVEQPPAAAQVQPKPDRIGD